MNKAEKIILSMGLLLWVFGDLITTYIAFSVGLPEQNPSLKDKTFFQIVLLKTIVLGIILMMLGHLENINKDYLKKPIYAAMIIAGAIATAGNTIAILGRI